MRAGEDRGGGAGCRCCAALRQKSRSLRGCSTAARRASRAGSQCPLCPAPAALHAHAGSCCLWRPGTAAGATWRGMRGARGCRLVEPALDSQQLMGPKAAVALMGCKRRPGRRRRRCPMSLGSLRPSRSQRGLGQAGARRRRGLQGRRGRGARARRVGRLLEQLECRQDACGAAACWWHASFMLLVWG